VLYCGGSFVVFNGSFVVKVVANKYFKISSERSLPMYRSPCCFDQHIYFFKYMLLIFLTNFTTDNTQQFYY
jgi:hypothetical protein